MSLLSKSQILEAADLHYEDVPVPEWGGEVRVKSLSGTERDAFEVGIATQAGKGQRMNLQNIRARLVALACVDEKGQRLFEDKDVLALGQKNAAALDRLFAAAQRLAGLGAKDMEAITANFPPGPNGNSTTA